MTDGMTDIGPALEALTRRLGETPAEFLEEPRIGGHGTVATAALVNDLFATTGERLDLPALRRFEAVDRRGDRNRLALVAIATWLLADDWFVAAGLPNDAVLALLDGTVAELAEAAGAHDFVRDDLRREELARTALARLGCRPEGETQAQAADRLSAVSATERRRLLDASRAAEARARAVREALVRKAAAEAADKWTRE